MALGDLALDAAGGKEAFGQMDGIAALSKHFSCIAYDRASAASRRARRAARLDLYVVEAKTLLDLAGAKDAFILAAAWAPRSRSPSRCVTPRVPGPDPALPVAATCG